MLAADYSIQGVLFVPDGSRDDRGPAMMEGLRSTQQQWEAWGWTFRLDDELLVVRSDQPASAFNSTDSFSQIRGETEAALRAEGLFNPTVKYAIFAEDTRSPGAAAQGQRPGNITIHYDFAVEDIARGTFGVIGHEFGHNVGLRHERCNDEVQGNTESDIPSVGPMCNSPRFSVPIEQFPATYQRLVAEADGAPWLAEEPGGYEWDLTFLSDLTPTFQVGLLELDQSVAETRIDVADNPYSSGFDKGLGVEAPSLLIYNLFGGGYERFQASVGLNNVVPDNAGSVRFRVEGDGVTLYESGLMTGGSRSEYIDVNVAGVSSLALVVQNGGDGSVDDFADWANARLVRETALRGDYNRDGQVDADDLTVWVADYGAQRVDDSPADGNRDGRVDAADYTFWRDRLGDAESFPISASDNAYTRFSDEPQGFFEENLLVGDVGIGIRVVAIDGQSSAVNSFYDLPAGGRVFVSANGSIDIIANGLFADLDPGESRVVAFNYTIEDESGERATAEVFLTIVGAPVPGFVGGAAAATTDSPVSPVRQVVTPDGGRLPQADLLLLATNDDHGPQREDRDAAFESLLEEPISAPLRATEPLGLLPTRRVTNSVG